MRLKGEVLNIWDRFAASSAGVYGRILNDLRARVAQLVEQLICNQRVAGSTPVSGSNRESGGVPEWSKGTDCKSVGEAFGGSNPPPTTNL